MDRTARPLSRASSAVLNRRAAGARPSAKTTTTTTTTTNAKKRKRAAGSEVEEDASTLMSREERIVIQVRSMDEEEEDSSFEEQTTDILQPHASSPPQQPAALELRVCQTVSRLQLPLVYVDTGAEQNAYPRLFRGRLRALEEAPPGEQLLIAEDVARQQLFAIEGVQEEEGVFALCALQPWVTPADLERKVKSRRTTSTREPRTKVERWWEPVSPPKSRNTSTGNEALIGLRRRFTMKPQTAKGHVGLGLEQPTQFTDEASQQTQEPLQVQDHAENTVLQADVSSAELLAAIKNHYLDSLYIHRTPLAYFVKGPLSRARGGVRQDIATALQYQELIDFLRSHIMTLTMGSKKYDESLGELVREIPVGLSPDDVDNQVTTPLKDRIRKSKKRKQLSKGGLLPGEEDYVLRWWVKREATLEYEGEDDTRESRIKRGLTDQRARETQLQIILILETLALEALAAREGFEHPQPGQVNDTEEATKKKRKPIDLNKVLDVLIDRLCIWESMNLDAPKAAKNESSDAHKKAKQASKETESDCLRDFCTDIVVPYYATRLPELYVSIGQKLGGPSLTSSPPVMRTPAPKKKLVKPGAAVARAPPPKKDPNAHHEKPVPRRAPAPLARSATDAHLPSSLKRELSAVDLSDLPRHRPSLHQSRRYSQREVDLPAAAAATEARRARKAAAEQELQSAIAALRKPNARLAVQDFVDAAEQHAAARHAAKSRKSKQPQPTRNPFAATAVQVTATPKINRHRPTTRDRTAYTLPPPPGPVMAHTATAASIELIPPSSDDARVPSSSMKQQPTAAAAAIHHHHHPRAEDIMQTPLPPPPQRCYHMAAAAAAAVDATPSRKRAKVVPARRPSTSLTSGVPEMAGPAPQMGSSPPLPPPVQRTPEAAFKRPVVAVPESATKKQPTAPKQQAPLEMFCTPVKALPAARRVAFAVEEVPEDFTVVAHEEDATSHVGDVDEDDDDDDDAVDVVPLVSSTPARETETAEPRAAAAAASASVRAEQPACPAATPHEATEPARASVKAAGPVETDIYAMLGWNDDDAYD